MKAPDFALPDQNGTIHKLSDYLGRWVVIYFYPKDDTPGCTVEACSFRDSLKTLREMNVAVVGISKDSINSHTKFADKFKLTFPLLSDETKKTIKAYGAWGKKKFLGREFEGILRNTTLVDPYGTIKKIYEKVTPPKHVQEIIKDIESFNK